METTAKPVVEVSISDFYKAIGPLNVSIMVPDGLGCNYTEFVDKVSGMIIGFASDSIIIDDSNPGYCMATYYLKNKQTTL